MGCTSVSLVGSMLFLWVCRRSFHSYTFWVCLAAIGIFFDAHSCVAVFPVAYLSVAHPSIMCYVMKARLLLLLVQQVLEC